ncbi:MAG: response regulator transcription factor [Deltaproteobacteria bacterium]|nr:MAG: response regulator transcription factor [Deltaproteobacteria bacterium]
MNQAQPIRVLLAEDHTIVRQGLRLLLESQPDLTVVGEADNGEIAISLAEELQPSVAVLDLAMPKCNGIDALPLLLQASPNTRVLVLSMHDEPEYVRPAIRAGAQGYLLKGADMSDLVKAVRSLAEGHSFFSPSIASYLVQDRQPSTSEDNDNPLTPREAEILQWIAEGYTSPQIAQRLSISHRTVDTHRTRIMQKLNIHNIAGLVKYALRHGLATLD